MHFYFRFEIVIILIFLEKTTTNLFFTILNRHQIVSNEADPIAEFETFLFQLRHQKSATSQTLEVSFIHEKAYLLRSILKDKPTVCTAYICRYIVLVNLKSISFGCILES